MEYSNCPKKITAKHTLSMPKMKTRKCISKRVKITGKKKVFRRKSRQNHFNARQDGDHKRAKRTDKIVKGKESKAIISDIRASL